MKFALPIGISFYTLQAVSYLIDVYYEKIEADDNLGRLALYLSFFSNPFGRPGLPLFSDCQSPLPGEAIGIQERYLRPSAADVGII